MRATPTSRQLTARRVRALVLLSVLGAAAAAEEWHLLTVRHVECAAHGELTHADDAVLVAGSDRGVSAAPAREGGHRHEHGNLAIFTHALVQHFNPEGVAFTAPLELPSRPTSVVVAVQRLWSLAPKASPPLS